MKGFDQRCPSSVRWCYRVARMMSPVLAPHLEIGVLLDSCRIILMSHSLNFLLVVILLEMYILDLIVPADFRGDVAGAVEVTGSQTRPADWLICRLSWIGGGCRWQVRVNWSLCVGGGHLGV